jgi:hypothetical protein
MPKVVSNKLYREKSDYTRFEDYYAKWIIQFINENEEFKHLKRPKVPVRWKVGVKRGKYDRRPRSSSGNRGR